MTETWQPARDGAYIGERVLWRTKKAATGRTIWMSEDSGTPPTFWHYGCAVWEDGADEDDGPCWVDPDDGFVIVEFDDMIPYPEVRHVART